MKIKTESGADVASLLNRERLYSSILLFLLLVLTFSPLIFGKNFIPFEKYPYWSTMLAQSSGQQFQFDSSFFKRLKLMRWAEEPELGSIGITWAENLYFAHALKNGKLPLWDPYTGGGVPTLDSGQCRPFNPFRLPFYLFPTGWMYSFTLLLGLVFGGIGAYLCFLRHGLSSAAATLGTGLFVLNPWALDRLVLTDSSAYFVLPWCILALQHTVWGRWPSIARAVLCFVLMGHSGHPVMSIVMACVAFAVYLCGERRPGNEQQTFVEKTKIIGMVGALTAACLIVLWLPLLRLFAGGDIYKYKKHALFVYEYSWKSLIALPADMFVPPAVGLILVCALLSWEKLPKVWVAFLAAVPVLLFPLPLFGTRLSNLLSFLGLPPMYLKGLFWASVSFLAPYGLYIHRASRRTAAITALAVGVGMLAVTGWQFTTFPMTKEDLSPFPITAFLLIGFGLLILAAFRTALEKLSPVLISIIILAPLAFPLSLNKLAWNTVDFKTNPVVEWLKTNRPDARAASVDSRTFFAIPPNLGQVYGVRCVEVNSVIFLNNYRSMFQNPRALPTAVFFDYYSPNAITQMGASVVLLPNDTSQSGLDLLIKGIRFSAFSIPGAHGRLYFAERACHYKPSMNFINQILTLSRETDAVAVVEAMGNPVPAVIPEIPPGEGKTAFERDNTDEVLIRTECPLEGLLVLRDSWYPGWMAFIDGEKTPILRVNGCFRGVLIPEGQHMVRFVYRPLLVYVAGGLSLLATVAVALAAVWKNPAMRIKLPSTDAGGQGDKRKFCFTKIK